MRRLPLFLVLAAILVTSGCTLPDLAYNLGGRQYYSAGGTDDASRNAHFDAERDRWKQYEHER